MMRAALAVAAALLVGGCGHNFDVEKVLKITDVHTGWYDAGIQDGKNKLVPSISLKLENTSDEQVESVQVNAIFRQMGDTQAWGEHFATAIDRDGLPAHRTTPGYLVLRSNLGYTGTESRLQMLQNSNFIDAKVEIYGKHGARTWQKLGEYKIDRQLLTQ
ncbi:MAG: hypothetical protein DMF87_13375 [Acidobacteria bacterium]|nr:MAG: hypothetical protein DMF88_15010 [Acidobacteriota bacterium]PYR78756.1 MAG: hypothetical protein DMF87_13375 [Acidobacteriota bacterium]